MDEYLDQLKIRMDIIQDEIGDHWDDDPIFSELGSLVDQICVILSDRDMEINYNKLSPLGNSVFNFIKDTHKVGMTRVNLESIKFNESSETISLSFEGWSAFQLILYNHAKGWCLGSLTKDNINGLYRTKIVNDGDKLRRESGRCGHENKTEEEIKYYSYEELTNFIIQTIKENY
jgi:hypothetical protein